jgi:hypothetical protein
MSLEVYNAASLESPKCGRYLFLVFNPHVVVVKNIRAIKLFLSQKVNCWLFVNLQEHSAAEEKSSSFCLLQPEPQEANPALHFKKQEVFLRFGLSHPARESFLENL